jgi:hypothetical protein
MYPLIADSDASQLRKLKAVSISGRRSAISLSRTVDAPR